MTELTLPAVLEHDPERRRDIAHIGPVELFTPTLEQSTRFFVDLLGLEEVDRSADRVLLHCWDDYLRFSVRLVQRATPGIGVTFLRAASPEALDRLIGALRDFGTSVDPHPAADGLGETFHFEDPDGHPYALYWGMDVYVPDEAHRPALKNQAAAFPGRGANVRRLDHVNYLAADVPAVASFLSGPIGARCTERIVMDSGIPSAVWYSITNKSYDLVYTSDWTSATGRLHHLAFAVDTRENILQACDVFLEAGIHIETGPHKHAIQQTFFLYVWEPGGNRIELCNAGSRLILAPDAPTISWSAAERRRGQAWGLQTISTFHTYGTPVVEVGED
jgi:catechol 2,3-dioxygenase